REEPRDHGHGRKQADWDERGTRTEAQPTRLGNGDTEGAAVSPHHRAGIVSQHAPADPRHDDDEMPEPITSHTTPPRDHTRNPATPPPRGWERIATNRCRYEGIGAGLPEWSVPLADQSPTAGRNCQRFVKISSRYFWTRAFTRRVPARGLL